MQRLTMWMCTVLVLVAPCVWGAEGEAGVEGLSLDVGEVLRLLSRERRATLKTNTAIAGFSWEERVQLIRIHNAKRRLVGASNMRHITWDTDVEKKAQDWIGGCNSGHSSNAYRTTSTFSYLGENIWGGTGGYTEDGAVSDWDDEKNYYFSSNFSCQTGQVCGHYTQVAWASTYTIGCGIKFCNGWYWVACQYGPGGNIRGQNPFTLGTACSACPSTASTCDNGLCRPDLTCNSKTCQNGGVLLTDVCECNCTGTGFSGGTCQQTGNSAIRVASPVMTVSVLAMAVLALNN